MMKVKVIKNTSSVRTTYTCGGCGHISIFSTFNYCPYCGTELDFEVDNPAVEKPKGSLIGKTVVIIKPFEGVDKPFGVSHPHIGDIVDVVDDIDVINKYLVRWKGMNYLIPVDSVEEVKCNE